LATGTLGHPWPAVPSRRPWLQGHSAILGQRLWLGARQIFFIRLSLHSINSSTKGVNILYACL